MFRDKKYRILKFCNGSLWFAFRLSLALSGSIWPSQAPSGSLHYLAHKALAWLAASLLRYNTLVSPDFGYSEQNQLNLFVMLSLYKACDCDGHKIVRRRKCVHVAPILHLTEPDGRIKVLEELMPGQLLWRKILGEQKMLQNRWRYH